MKKAVKPSPPKPASATSPKKPASGGKRGGAFTVKVNVIYREGVLDPQGQAVLGALHSLGFEGVQEVRVGKHFTLQVKAKDRETAQKAVSEMCAQLLSNPVLESYSISISD